MGKDMKKERAHEVSLETGSCALVVIVAAKKNETSNSEGIRVHLVFYILYNCGINRKYIV